MGVVDGWPLICFLCHEGLKRRKHEKGRLGGKEYRARKQHALTPGPSPASGRGEIFLMMLLSTGGEGKFGNGLLAQAGVGSGAGVECGTGVFVGGRFINLSNRQGFSTRRRFRRDCQAN